MLQDMEEDDSKKRVVFVEEQLEHMEHDPNFLKNLKFSDEAHFQGQGSIFKLRECAQSILRLENPTIFS
uniref:Uncharacterized protein n=1 Tax=Acrobeloides nanus TaxID=290746 RepID=A0A914CDG9_9BILA